MSSNFMRSVFPGITGLSGYGGASTWIPVISTIDTVCRLLCGAFALFGTYCFVCGILTHATTHGATTYGLTMKSAAIFLLTRPLMARLSSSTTAPTTTKFQLTRPIVPSIVSVLNSFQLTRPLMARLYTCTDKKGGYDFNSRDHSWRDYILVRTRKEDMISTHATTQGVTLHHKPYPKTFRISTHATTQGTTRRQQQILMPLTEFQLTRLRKARHGFLQGH